MGAHLQPIALPTRAFFAEDPATGDEGPVFWTLRKLSITEMRAVIKGGASPSVTWTVRHATSRAAAGAEVVTGGTVTTNTTTGDSVTTLDSPNVPAGSFVWLELVSVTTGANAPDEFSVTLVANG